jgi:hypothetical protein
MPCLMIYWWLSAVYETAQKWLAQGLFTFKQRYKLYLFVRPKQTVGQIKSLAIGFQY